MAVVLQPFSQTAFNSLRNLEEAGPRFDELDTKKIIEEEIGPLFREYDVDENFGIQLLHLHAKLEAGEYLTEVRGTSSPIRVGDYPRLRTFATVWKLRFKDGKSFFQPLEYILGSGDDMIDGASPLTDDHLMAFFESRKDFLPKLQGILGKYDLGDLLGLVHHPGVGFPGRVEITSGRSNINLTPMEVCSS
jgi:hypothetical protein